MRHERFDYAVSSDLSRAMETAVTIRAGLPVVSDPRWREFAFGEWEGLTWERIVERWPQAGAQGRAAARAYTPPGGESFASVAERVGSALDELARSEYRNVLVATHAGPLHAMLQHVFGKEQAQVHEIVGVRFTPASITRIAIAPDGAELVALNDVSHL